MAMNRRWVRAPAVAGVAAAAASLALGGCTHGQPGPAPTPPATSGPATSAAPSGTPAPTAVSGTPSPPGGGSPVGAAAFHITGLAPGHAISLPAQIRYQVAGPAHMLSSLTAGSRVRVQVGSSGYAIELPITGPSGTITLPRDKFLTGIHDLTFVVLNASGAHVSGVPAVTIRDATIIGPK